MDITTPILDPGPSVPVRGTCWAYRLTVVLALALGTCSPLMADSGPVIFCSACNTTPHFSLPKSGFWFNPERPGSGFTLEVQDGLLVGALYAYRPDGNAQWYLFNGRLAELGRSAYTLGLSTELERFEGGMCLNCSYSFPNYVLGTGRISIEFTQRNYGSYTIDGGERQFIVPLITGVDAPRDFGDLVDYGFPVLSDQWTFVFDNPTIGGPWGTVSVVLSIDNRSLTRDELGRPVQLSYSIARYEGTQDVNVPGSIRCVSEVDDLQNRLPPVCKISLVHDYPGLGWVRVEFPVQYANFGDDRIEAVDPGSGIRLVAFRVGYN